MVDLSLKPTLATFPFREQPEDKQPVRALHRAEDGDDALLAMIDSRGELAAAKLKMGRVRQAMRVLHETYQIVESYVESYPPSEPLPPAAMLAAAVVRLALCSVLSGMGRHEQALHEAKMGAVEIDKVWRALFLASAEQEEATADGDRSRPAASLRDALRNPPIWIERAVEVAVQTRHCVAIELEYGAQANPEKYELPARNEEGLLPLGEGEVPDPVPVSEKFTVQEQIGRLHREGVTLSRQLLRPNHPVRGRAERALDEWLQRTGGDGQPNLPAPEEPLSPRSMSRRRMIGQITKNAPLEEVEAPAPAPIALSLEKSRSGAVGFSVTPTNFEASEDGLPQICRRGVRNRLPAKESISTMSLGGVATTASIGAASLGSLGSTYGEASGSRQGSKQGSRLNASQSAPQLYIQQGGVKTYINQLSYANAPPGEVYMASLPKKENSLPAIKTKKSADAEGDLGEQPGMGANATVSPPPIPKRGKTLAQKAKEADYKAYMKDPFEYWRKNMVNEDQLTHFQKQLRSETGLHALQGELADCGRHFRNFELRDMDPSVMYDCRIMFGPASIVQKKQIEKKENSQKKEGFGETAEAQSKKGTNQKLFKYYHVPATDKPNLGAMKTLLSKSHTHGVNLEKLALQEQRRQHAEKLAARSIKLTAASGSPKKSKSPRKKPEGTKEGAPVVS